MCQLCVCVCVCVRVYVCVCVCVCTLLHTGLPIALYNVGGHYFAGKGVEHSFKKAAEYYQQAADQGFTPAQVRLNCRHYIGS